MIRPGALAVSLLALVACGVKAPPRPPERSASGARPEPAIAAPCTDGCADPGSTSTTQKATP